jgi:hypothetical protein
MLRTTTHDMSLRNGSSLRGNEAMQGKKKGGPPQVGGSSICAGVGAVSAPTKDEKDERQKRK